MISLKGCHSCLNIKFVIFLNALTLNQYLKHTTSYTLYTHNVIVINSTIYSSTKQIGSYNISNSDTEKETLKPNILPKIPTSAAYTT